MLFHGDYLSCTIGFHKVEGLHRIEVNHFKIFIGEIMVLLDGKIGEVSKKKKRVIYENVEINVDQH